VGVGPIPTRPIATRNVPGQPATSGAGVTVYNDTYAVVSAETPGVGDTGFITDNPALSLHCASASTWLHRYSGAGAVTPPSGFLTNWRNQGASTYSEATGSGVLVAENSGGGTDIRARTGDYVGASTYRCFLNTSGGNDEALMGVCFSDGTIFVVFYLGIGMKVRRYSDANTFAGDLLNVGNAHRVCGWYEMKDTGTNVEFGYSPNGVDYNPVYSAAYAVAGGAGFVPDEVGIFGDSENASGRDVTIVCAHWEVL